MKHDLTMEEFLELKKHRFWCTDGREGYWKLFDMISAKHAVQLEGLTQSSTGKIIMVDIDDFMEEWKMWNSSS
jgi:hypothetical protein